VQGWNAFAWTGADGAVALSLAGPQLNSSALAAGTSSKRQSFPRPGSYRYSRGRDDFHESPEQLPVCGVRRPQTPPQCLIGVDGGIKVVPLESYAAPPAGAFWRWLQDQVEPASFARALWVMAGKGAVAPLAPANSESSSSGRSKYMRTGEPEQNGAANEELKLTACRVDGRPLGQVQKVWRLLPGWAAA
jgi:hypothetical protein